VQFRKKWLVFLFKGIADFLIFLNRVFLHSERDGNSQGLVLLVPERSLSLLVWPPTSLPLPTHAPQQKRHFVRLFLKWKWRSKKWREKTTRRLFLGVVFQHKRRCGKTTQNQIQDVWKVNSDSVFNWSLISTRTFIQFYQMINDIVCQYIWEIVDSFFSQRCCRISSKEN
jgi:hypothetical protein